MWTELETLVARNRTRGVLVDSNLVTLLLVGAHRRDLVLRYKRTANYSLADFDLLESVVLQFGRIVTTPSILAEVSNLTNKGAAPEALRAIRGGLQAWIHRADETYQPSAVLTTSPLFVRLGLTDCSVVDAARDCLTLTADLDLYVQCQARGLDAVNFTHYLRPGE